MHDKNNNKNENLFELVTRNNIKEFKYEFRKYDYESKLKLITSVNKRYGKNLLHYCCLFGAFNILKYLIKLINKFKNKFIILNSFDNDGKTCLIYGCSKGHEDIVEYLLKIGVDINCLDSNGDSPLHYTIFENKFNLFKLLISYNAKIIVNQHTNNLTPIQLASYSGLTSFIDYISRNRSACTRVERIVALEILGCALIKSERYNEAIVYWRKSLEERTHLEANMNGKMNNSIKIGERNIQEFMSFDELNSLEFNSEELVMQSIVVMKRNFGIKHSYTHEHIIKCAEYHLKRGNYNISIEILTNEIENQMRFYNFHYINECFLQLFFIFQSLQVRNMLNAYKHYFLLVFKYFELTITNIIEYFKLDTIVYSDISWIRQEFTQLYERLAIYLLKFSTHINSSGVLNMFEIKRYIYKCIKYELISNYKSRKLIHLVLAHYQATDDEIIGSIELLIRLGGKSIMSSDCLGNTPLHLVVNRSFQQRNNKQTLVKYLLDNGAHIDATNKIGVTPIDLMLKNKENNFCMLSNIIHYQTLKCLSARVIKKYEIILHNQCLNEDMKTFIEIH